MESIRAAPEGGGGAFAPRLGGASLLDRVRDLRDRMVADPAFRRWAARFPLTRPIARRRARALFDLCAGFVYSQILAACVRLRLFDLLRDGPQTVQVIAARSDMPPDAAARLLGAAAALGLLAHRSGGRYGLGPLGAAMVGNPGLAAMVEHHAVLYADLRDPVALLRSDGAETGLARYWPYAGDGTAAAGLGVAEVAEYSALMAASQPLVAEEVLAAYDLRRHRCLLDVGGGEGGFLCAAGAAAPELRLVLFDLPAVAERAKVRFMSAGLDARASAVGGDFLADPLPAGADVVSLVRVLHDHDDDGALAILRAVRRSLPPGGTLLLAEPMSGTPGAEPVGEAYFGFYLLAMGRGRPRTPGEIGALLRAAGFPEVRRRRTRTPLLTSVLTARPA